MRDLYNRKARLEYWIDRINKDLDGNDRKDVLKFVEIMQEKNQSILTIIRCITAIIAEELRYTYQPLFEKHNVDLVISTITNIMKEPILYYIIRKVMETQ